MATLTEEKSKMEASFQKDKKAVMVSGTVQAFAFLNLLDSYKLIL